MPLELFYLPSYERCVKRLGHAEKRITGLVVLALLEHFKSGASAGAAPFIAHLEGRAYRLVFKKLEGAVWEAYIEGHVRALTRLQENRHFLVFAGNHDQVRRFLKES